MPHVTRCFARVGLAALAVACDPGNVTLTEPSQPGDGGDVLLVSPVGAGERALAGAAVTVLKVNSTDYRWQHAAADSTGQAPFQDVDAGFWYWVWAEYADSSGAVYGGGEKVAGGSLDSASPVEVPLSGPRLEGVVISEVSMVGPQSWEVGGSRAFEFGNYIELANNGPGTIYLDGMLVGVVYFAWSDAGSFGHHRCADTEPMRNDSAGVWTHIIWQIPGSGTEHPLAPGAVAVLAVSAADHTEILPSMPDLSDADFEFGTDGSGDNPAAPDLVWRGPNPPRTVTNEFSLARAFWFVADAADPDTFERAYDPGFTDRKIEYRRVPASLLEDVAFIWWDSSGEYTQTGRAIPCRDPVNPRFDRIPGGFLRTEDDELSAQRRRITVGGRSVLLDTNTSAVDFVKAGRTPGWLP